MFSARKNSSLEIAVLCTGDGSNPTLQRNLRSLSTLGIPTAVLCWDRLHKHDELVRPLPNISYTVLLKGFGLRNRKLWFALWIWALRAAATLLSKRPRLTFAHNFEAGLVAWAASAFNRRPYIYHIHDNFSLSHTLPLWLTRLIDDLDRRIIRSAFATIVPAPWRILAYAEPFRHKILVLPNTYSRPHVARCISASNSHNRLTVLVIGSLREDRGIALLLKAARDLRDVRLLMAGHVFDKTVAREMENHPSVDYRGLLSHDDTLALYAESDIAFMFYEPSVELNIRAVPIKLGEALMMGVPVLLNSETLISRQVVEDWGVGFRCSFELGALSSLLASLRADRAQLRALRERALDAYEKYYRWEHYEGFFLGAAKRALGRNAGCEAACSATEYARGHFPNCYEWHQTPGMHSRGPAEFR